MLVISTYRGIATERANESLNCPLEEDVSDVASDAVAHEGGLNQRKEGEDNHSHDNWGHHNRPEE